MKIYKTKTDNRIYYYYLDKTHSFMIAYDSETNSTIKQNLSWPFDYIKKSFKPIHMGFRIL